MNSEEISKKYTKTKIILSFLSTITSFVFLIVVIISGFSKIISEISYSVFSNDYLVLLLFSAILGIFGSIISFSFNFYSGYCLEHKYNLSNQKLLSWFWENIKSFLVSLPILVPLLLVFLFLLKTYENSWWFLLGVVFLFFSVILARLAPVFILPLFYKFKPLENESLKNRLLNLCNKACVSVNGVFSFNLSKETKKANAGFTGIGKSKRIILADNLLNKFSEEEIEVVFAHELGHYKFGHIWKGMLISTLFSFLGLYLVSEIYKTSLVFFGFRTIHEIAAFPLIGLLFSLFALILLPATNFYSRYNEIKADEYALLNTKNLPAFESTMLKLGEMNLSDKNPNPFIEFLFYSHPSINNRIRKAKEKIFS